MRRHVKTKITIIFIIGLLLLSFNNTSNLINNVNAIKVEDFHSISNDSFSLSKLSDYDEGSNLEPNNIQNIELKDDAFHGTHNFFSVEWWYFDAILNDDYNLHAGFKVFSIRNFGIVWPIIEIYKGRELKVKNLKPYLIKDLSASSIYPSVKIGGKSIIEFDMDEYNNTGTWKYNVSINMKNNGVNLTFIGTTKGWKYTILNREGWAVALPKANVFGTIKIDGKIINVTGRGYHDHNWNYTIKTKIREWGWYWARLSGQNYSLISAWFLKSPIEFDNLVVLNKDFDGYTELNSKEINLSFLKYITLNGILVPSQIRIFLKNISVNIDVLMNVSNIFFVGSPRFYYCRYFVNVTGFISKDDEIERFVNSIQMFEVMKFK